MFILFHKFIKHAYKIKQNTKPLKHDTNFHLERCSFHNSVNEFNVIIRFSVFAKMRDSSLFVMFCSN